MDHADRKLLFGTKVVEHVRGGHHLRGSALRWSWLSHFIAMFL